MEWSRFTDGLAQDWRNARRRSPLIATSLLIVYAIVSLAAVAGSLWYLVSVPIGLPDREAISRIGEMDQATEVYDNRDELAFTIYKEQRIDTPLAEMSPNLLHAVLAIEDQRFYDHSGFDGLRIASAALTNVRHRRAAQGGSTITQQLARQSFLTTEKTIHRKLQELILADRIERLYTKPQIFELYLNKVYFGDGLYGAEAASRGYFGKHAWELSVAEAALLAGLVKSPSKYAPTVNIALATARRNVVLQAMLDAGFIERPMWQQARTTPVVLHDNLRAGEPYGQYFKEQIRRELVERFGWQRVYLGGLRVFSTIDMPMQRGAEAAVAESLKAIDEKRAATAARRRAARKQTPPPRDSEPLQAALVALDPSSGHIRAMVGGRDFNESRFNRAVQARRQPGSAFKPFVYATALEAGYTPATVLGNLNDPIATVQGAWAPDDGHSTATFMTLRTGLRTSSNRAAVRLLQEVGIPQAVQYARAMGVGDVPAVPSLALGSGEVTLETMTAAYAAFANKGNVPKPMLIRRVEDREGRLLYEGRESTTRAVSETTAFLMSSMMADVVNAGTAAGVRRLGFTLPAAGKTGTTNDFNDAWFVGYTPKLAAGVWVGFDRPHTIMRNGFAADIAVPVWAKFMKAATRDDKPEWLPTPSSVTTATVCRLSGKLATEGCQDVEVVARNGNIERRSMVYTEYFARGTEPTTSCDLHPTHGIFGAIAGIFGGGDSPAPPTRIEDTGLAPGAVGMTGSVEPLPPAPREPRRGFWSRILRGGAPDEVKDTAPPKP